jgi:TRAP-type C4-dicarboxylate transport system substrate-binding protein
MTFMPAGIIRAAAIGAILTSLLTGCTQADQSNVAQPVTLTLLTYDAKDTRGGALVEHFIDEVRRLDPSITITPRFAEAPHEPDAVAAVSDGSADLVMVASRAFDTAGVTTLQALNTPLLIDSTALANAVATSEHVPDLLAGLEEIGVIGLAITPEGMRHLFGDKHAPVHPRDLQGATVRAPQSEAVWSLMSAAGATPIFDDTREHEYSESQYDLALGATEATGNVTLFAKFDVFAINEASARHLSETQVDALRRAATESTTWAIGKAGSDAAMAKDFCANGGRIVAATPAQLVEWQALAEPVIEALRSEPRTAELMDAITDMKAGIKADRPVTGCDARTGSPDPAVDSRLDGTYTFTVTASALTEAGIHDSGFIDLNAGDYTVTLKGGTLRRTQRYTSGPRAGERETDTLSYTLDGDTVTFRWSAQPSDFTEAKFTVLPDGSLEFSDWVEGLSEPKFLLSDPVVLRRWERVR